MLSGSLLGNAKTATQLENAREIGGTAFDGSQNIEVALAQTAATLANPRNIGGVSFNGSQNIDLPGVNAEGNQNTSGTAESAGKVTVTADDASANHPITFIDDTVPDGEAETMKASRNITVNPNTGELTLAGLRISYTQGDGRSTFGTITFTGTDAAGASRSATISMR